MANKVSSRAKKSAERARANKAIAVASSAKAAKVTKAVHLAIGKALPNLLLGQGGQAPATQGAKGPGTIEPKAFLVFVIPL